MVLPCPGRWTEDAPSSLQQPPTPSTHKRAYLGNGLQCVRLLGFVIFAQRHAPETTAAQQTHLVQIIQLWRLEIGGGDGLLGLEHALPHVGLPSIFSVRIPILLLHDATTGKKIVSTLFSFV